MAVKGNRDLLDHIEEKAQDTSPLWQWLLWAGLLALPWLIGAIIVWLIEGQVGSLYSTTYSTTLHVMTGVTLVMLLAVITDSKRGYTRRLLRRPDPKYQRPGIFRLGAGMTAHFWRLWWGFPAAIVGFSLFNRWWDRRALGIHPQEIFWNGMIMIGSFTALLVAFLFVLSLVGLIVRYRLGERGRPV